MITKEIERSLDKLRSNTHGARITRGSLVEKVTLNFLKESGMNAKKGERIKIDHESQRTYKPDIQVETNDEILLIDTKSEGHNNNTPVSDHTKKYQLCRETKQGETTKIVRFILLKETKHDISKLILEHESCGIELHHIDEFVTNLTGRKFNLLEESDVEYRNEVLPRALSSMSSAEWEHIIKLAEIYKKKQQSK
jgi:hypothetical protein